MTSDRDVKTLANAGYRQGGVVRSRLGTIYQFGRSEAEEFCRKACSLGIYLEELQ